MQVCRTITFLNDTPGAGLEVGIKYPIISVNGINKVVDLFGDYHDEPEDSRFLDYCEPYYSIEIVDWDEQKQAWRIR